MIKICSKSVPFFIRISKSPKRYLAKLVNQTQPSLSINDLIQLKAPVAVLFLVRSNKMTR